MHGRATPVRTTQDRTQNPTSKVATRGPSPGSGRAGHRRSAVTTPSLTAVRPGTTRTVATVASAILAALMLVESALGLAVDGLYPEAPWAVAALRGNDLVSLVLAPVLATAIVLGRRDDRWALVWLSGLLYGTYNYAYYAFGTAFNDVFLLHVASLTSAVVGLVGLAASFDVHAVGRRVGPVAGRRVIAGFMVVVGGALVVAWGGFSLRFALIGALPDDVMPPSAVHLVYALDLSLLAPAFIAGGILLWRRTDWGHVLGVAVNLFGAAYLVVLELVGGFEAQAGIPGTTWASPPALAGAALCALAAAHLLRSVGRASSSPSTS